MTYRILDFYNAINKIAPFEAAEDWDNSGLLVGSRETEVKNVLVALDLTSGVLSEAIALGANLIITHHPVIFPSVKSIPAGSLLYRVIENKISVISAHTNLDISSSGVNAALCGLLSLENIRALESNLHPGMTCLGELEKPMEARELAAFVKDRLNAGGVKYTPGGTVTTVAVCGGSGSELLEDAVSHGAQALVTSEVKHHLMLAAAEARFTLIDAGHHATEAIAMPHLAGLLRGLLPGVTITVSDSQRDPALYL